MKNEILSTVLNRINNFNRVHFSLGYLVKLDRLNEKNGFFQLTLSSRSKKSEYGTYLDKLYVTSCISEIELDSVKPDLDFFIDSKLDYLLKSIKNKQKANMEKRFERVAEYHNQFRA